MTCRTDHIEISERNARLALVLWDEGCDTLTISKKLWVSEGVIANLLWKLREDRRNDRNRDRSGMAS